MFCNKKLTTDQLKEYCRINGVEYKNRFQAQIYVDLEPLRIKQKELLLKQRNKK